MPLMPTFSWPWLVVGLLSTMFVRALYYAATAAHKAWSMWWSGLGIRRAYHLWRLKKHWNAIAGMGGEEIDFRVLDDVRYMTVKVPGFGWPKTR